MLKSLIEDILDLTRLEEGQFELNMDTFKIKELVDLLKDLFGFQLEKKGLAMIIDVSDETNNKRIHSD